jgi:hypothetical protein
MKLILDAVCQICGDTIDDGDPVLLVARGKATTVDKACMEDHFRDDGDGGEVWTERNREKDTHLPEGKIRVITAGRPSRVESPGFRTVLCDSCAGDIIFAILEANR